MSVLILLVASVASLAGSTPQKRYDRLPRSEAQEYDTSVDICNHCGCEGVKIVCDFRINKTLSTVWDSKYFVQKKYRSIIVFLKSQIKLLLCADLLRDNQVNAIRFYGTKENDQVEIDEHAFRQNFGGFPEIGFFNLSDVFLQPHAIEGNDYKLIVENCTHLVGFPKSLQMTNLYCTIRNVDKCDLKQNAFHSGGAKTTATYVNLWIENSGISQINSFNQSMNKVSIINCTIGSIEQGAFDVTTIKELNFENNNIRIIKSKALTAKLLSDKVSMVNNEIGTIEGEAISQSGVSILIFTGNKVERIQSGAIQVNAANAYILNNTVKYTEKSWIIINYVTHVEMNNNSFDRFDTFQIKNRSVGFNCTFQNNRLKDPQPGSLDIDACLIHDIHVGWQCTCDSRTYISSLSHHDLDSEILCTLAESDQKCFNATSVNWRRYLYEACGVGRNSNATQYCINGRWSERSMSDQHSGNVWSSNGIAMGIVAVVAVIALVVVLIGVGCRRQSTNDKCSWSKSQLNLVNNEVNNLSNQEEYKDVCKAIIKLANKGTLSRPDCLNRITDILSCLPSKSPSNIKNLLTDHLNKYHPSNILNLEIQTQPPPSAPSPDLRDTNEPIYTEPNEELRLIPENTNSSQPPEFLSNYSYPLNPEENQYAEPFNTKANDIPPAYQYATPMRRLAPPQQPPSTVVKYSTPVWRSAPDATPTSRPPSGASVPTASSSGVATEVVPLWQRHVRDLRQDLEAMPQFHPNQLTSLRNQRQVQQNYPRHQQQQQQQQEQTLQQPPPYSGSRGPSGSRSFECLDGAASLAAMEHMDSGSDHSGGSDVTVQIGDVIAYADA